VPERERVWLAISDLTGKERWINSSPAGVENLGLSQATHRKQIWTS